MKDNYIENSSKRPEKCCTIFSRTETKGKVPWETPRIVIPLILARYRSTWPFNGSHPHYPRTKLTLPSQLYFPEQRIKLYQLSRGLQEVCRGIPRQHLIAK